MAGHSARRILLILTTCLVFAMMMAIVVLNRVYGQELGIFKNSTGDHGKKYEIMITPPSPVFYIWFVIYAFEAAFIMYGLSSLCRKTSSGTSIYQLSLTRPVVYILFIVNNLAVILWTFLWDREYIVAAMIIIAVIPFTLYISLFYSFRGLTTILTELYHQDCNREPWLVRILVHNGLSFYAGWATIAMLLNLGIVIIYEAQVDMEIVCVGVLGAIIFILLLWFWLDVFCFDLFTRYTFLMYVPPLAASGGLVAKLLLQQSIEDIEWNRYNIVVIATAGLCFVCFIIKIAVLIYRHRKHPIYKRTLISIEKGDEENPGVVSESENRPEAEINLEAQKCSTDISAVSPGPNHGVTCTDKSEEPENIGNVDTVPVIPDESNTVDVSTFSKEGCADSSNTSISNEGVNEPATSVGEKPEQTETLTEVEIESRGDDDCSPLAEQSISDDVQEENIETNPENSKDSPLIDFHAEGVDQSNGVIESNCTQDTLTTTANVECNETEKLVDPLDHSYIELIPDPPEEDNTGELVPPPPPQQISNQDSKQLMDRNECDKYIAHNQDEHMAGANVADDTNTSAIDQSCVDDVFEKPVDEEPSRDAQATEPQANDPVPPMIPVDIDIEPSPVNNEGDIPYYGNGNELEDDDDPRNYPQEFTGNGDSVDEFNGFEDNAYLPPPPPPPNDNNPDVPDQETHDQYEDKYVPPEDKGINNFSVPIAPMDSGMNNSNSQDSDAYNAEMGYYEDKSNVIPVPPPVDCQNGSMPPECGNDWDNIQPSSEMKNETLACEYEEDENGITSAV